MLPPKLNPEIIVAVSEFVKKKDAIIVARQKQTPNNRRSLIAAAVNKDMKDSLTGEADSFLFGSNLLEKIKNTKAVLNSGPPSTKCPNSDRRGESQPPTKTCEEGREEEQEAVPEQQPTSETLELQVGRLPLFIEKWKTITQDPTILRWVSGYQIPFDEIPSQTFCPMNNSFSSIEFSQIKLKSVSLWNLK
ncbi:hypothetical protein ACJJTC_007548 [Scirpophaga incertulas]